MRRRSRHRRRDPRRDRPATVTHSSTCSSTSTAEHRPAHAPHRQERVEARVGSSAIVTRTRSTSSSSRTGGRNLARGRGIRRSAVPAGVGVGMARGLVTRDASVGSRIRSGGGMNAATCSRSSRGRTSRRSPTSSPTVPDDPVPRRRLRPPARRAIRAARPTSTGRPSAAGRPALHRRDAPASGRQRYGPQGSSTAGCMSSPPVATDEVHLHGFDGRGVTARRDRRGRASARLGRDRLVNRELVDVGGACGWTPTAANASGMRAAKASKSARDSQKSMIPQPPSTGPDAWNRSPFGGVRSGLI